MYLSKVWQPIPAVGEAESRVSEGDGRPGEGGGRWVGELDLVRRVGRQLRQ